MHDTFYTDTFFNMADSHGNKSSAQKANIAANSWLSLYQIWLKVVLKMLFSPGEIQTYIEKLSSEISRSSTAETQAKLCKDTTGKLYSKRDDMIAFCKNKFSNFPKDKPLRRITRTGGKSANEKLASDLIALVKYCCSGEMSVEYLRKRPLLVHKAKKQRAVLIWINF